MKQPYNKGSIYNKMIVTVKRNIKFDKPYLIYTVYKDKQQFLD